jgi:hypothetical protein
MSKLFHLYGAGWWKAVFAHSVLMKGTISRGAVEEHIVPPHVQWFRFLDDFCSVNIEQML